jgi:phycobilisome core-membrane linker protein
LKIGTISVREFVRSLASSGAYGDRFCAPYPAPKVVEFLFRHLLGRGPSTSETEQYGALLSNGGLKTAVESLVNSSEYARYFGEHVVPYRRYPSSLVENLG